MFPNNHDILDNFKSSSYKKKLNSLHRRGIKLIMPGHLFTTEEKFSKLNILPLSQQFQNNTALLIFKIKTLFFYS